MTTEQYEEWLLGAQGKLLGHVTAAPEEPVVQKQDRRWTVAPIPYSMNGNDALRGPWGYHE